MSKTTVVRAALSCALLLLAAGCKPAAQPPAPPPPQVTVVTAEPRDVPIWYEYVGQTAGFREVEVRARVNGLVLKRNFKEGATVKRGESLFTIDPAPFQVALARAEADLGVSQARLEQARRDAKRLKPVLEAKAVSQKELDDAVSAAQIAEAEVKSAQSRVNEAKLNLQYTRVEAPINGVTSRAVVSEGTMVSGSSVLLGTVTQTDPMYVIFGIPDREFLAIRRDVEAGRVKLPGGNRFKTTLKLADGTPFAASGQMNFTDVRVNTQTGTSEARAEFANGRNSLRAGEFVRIVLEGAVRTGAIVVPQRAVLEGPKEKFVYIVNAENKVEQRPVQVGAWTADGWIIDSGVSQNERIIVDGVMKIGPGATVQATNADAAPRVAEQK